MKKTLFTFALFFMITQTVFATIASQTINYQGRLTDLSGNPVVDGVHNITVRLYDDKNATEGQSKWSDNYSIQTKNGYFNVVLASTTAFDPAKVDFSRQYWVGIRVDTDSEMTPRQPLNGVPYAMNIEVPVGSFLAWDKSRPNTPPLPSNFVECNGQTISDSESSYNGQTVPNLNGQARFLRGSSHSGDLQDDAFQGHEHDLGLNYNSNPFINTGACGNNTVYFGHLKTGSTLDDGHGEPRVANETRPINMSVVWIMRIK
jgi:hypothetical protein